MGMTLRDYFAAKAMQGFAAQPKSLSHWTAKEIAEDAYAFSDAMLAERDKPVDTAPPKP
jgi:hypothetical protein